MQREESQGITLEQKLRYLREVESIYRLGKKTKAPAGKSCEQIADARLRHVLGLPIREDAAEPLNLVPGAMHHEHSPRSARIIERTLKSGIVPPHVLRSYREGVHTTRNIRGRLKLRPHKEPLRSYDLPVQHFLQHVATDLHYPHGHLQGFGFEPRQHEVKSHVELQTQTVDDDVVVPTRPGPAAGEHYH